MKYNEKWEEEEFMSLHLPMNGNVFAIFFYCSHIRTHDNILCELYNNFVKNIMTLKKESYEDFYY